MIGGSIGAALKANGYGGHIIGIGRNELRLKAARQAELIDEGVTDVTKTSQPPTMWVFCTPVDRIVDGILQAAATAGKGTVFTDAGSTKQQICDRLSNSLPVGIEFVGSHPLAGSEKSGYENADPSIFKDRVCVTTPVESNSTKAVERIEALWSMLGMKLLRSDPQEHDELLAVTSHLPHVAAAALASFVNDHNQDFFAGGFRDTTRIAAGDPDLWTAILTRNHEHVATSIDELIQRLKQFGTAITARDEEATKRLLTEGQTGRQKLS